MSAGRGIGLAIEHEYVVTGVKTPTGKYKGELKDDSGYANPDNDPDGVWTTQDLTCNKTKSERPSLYYDLTDPVTGRVFKCSERRVWSYEKEKMFSMIARTINGRHLPKVIFPDSIEKKPTLKKFLWERSSDYSPISSWLESKNTNEKNSEVKIGFAPLNSVATKEFDCLFGTKPFVYPKATGLINTFVSQIADANGLVLDYFAGSGTTGHAVINLNREDGGSRKYILVEQGEYFDTVLKPRIQKVVYSENWSGGKPAPKDQSTNPHNGISHCFKYLKLESYEDTLNNLELTRSGEQQALFAQYPDLKQDYLLHYMLDVEAKGSLLNIDAFTQPFDYQLKIATASAGETRQQAVDLVETFNYLLGVRLHTQRYDSVSVTCQQNQHGIWERRTVRTTVTAGDPDTYTFLSLDGTLPDGKSALIIWRILNNFNDAISKTCHNIALDYYLLERKRINPREGELDVIYVNGDNTLPNIRTEGEHWKVRLIEEEFQRLMFAGEV
jgi:adenine-specific DNA-methyltransferase